MLASIDPESTRFGADEGAFIKIILVADYYRSSDSHFPNQSDQC